MRSKKACLDLNPANCNTRKEEDVWQMRLWFFLSVFLPITTVCAGYGRCAAPLQVCGTAARANALFSRGCLRISM